jgi:hypothetical protein
MTGAGWHVRPGGPDDRKLLASFACADLAVRWQAEVEQFIQAQLIDWAFDPHADAGDPRLLLAFTAAGDLFDRHTPQAAVGQWDAGTYQAASGTSCRPRSSAGAHGSAIPARSELQLTRRLGASRW